MRVNNIKTLSLLNVCNEQYKRRIQKWPIECPVLQKFWPISHQISIYVLLGLYNVQIVLMYIEWTYSKIVTRQSYDYYMNDVYIFIHWISHLNNLKNDWKVATTN